MEEFHGCPMLQKELQELSQVSQVKQKSHATGRQTILLYFKLPV
jgi:hypothetical protein